MTLPRCADCGHSPDLHGDRAIYACTGITTGYGTGLAYRVLHCVCSGYCAASR